MEQIPTKADLVECLLDVLLARLALRQRVRDVLLAELTLNRFQVAHRVNRVVHVHNVFTRKRAHNVQDAVDCLDVTQERIT